jgi:hypothetical protein
VRWLWDFGQLVLPCNRIQEVAETDTKMMVAGTAPGVLHPRLRIAERFQLRTRLGSPRSCCMIVLSIQS